MADGKRIKLFPSIFLELGRFGFTTKEKPKRKRRKKPKPKTLLERLTSWL